MFAQLNISLLKEFLDGLSQMDFGNCLMICGGRFDNEWMNCSLSLGFGTGDVSFCRFSETSRKSTSFV